MSWSLRSRARGHFATMDINEFADWCVHRLNATIRARMVVLNAEDMTGRTHAGVSDQFTRDILQLGLLRRGAHRCTECPPASEAEANAQLLEMFAAMCMSDSGTRWLNEVRPLAEAHARRRK